MSTFELTAGAHTVWTSAECHASGSTVQPWSIDTQPGQPMASKRRSPDRRGHSLHCPPPPGVGPRAAKSLAETPTRPPAMALDDRSPMACTGTVIRSGLWDEKAQ